MRPNSTAGLEPYRNNGWDASSFKSVPYDPAAPSALRSPPRRAGRLLDKIPIVAMALQAVAFGVSVATVGLLVNAIAIYKSSKDWKIVMGSGVILPGWHDPSERFMVPIYSLLASATTSTMLGAIILGFTIFVVSCF